MKDSLITILITNFNSSDFILNNLYYLKKLTRNKYNVLIRDNNSKIKDYLKLKKFIKYFPNVELYRVENFKFKGSMAHGIALNDLITKIDTRYGVILDPDCVFLRKNWDEILINKLDDKHPIIGTQAPTISAHNRLKDFPVIIGILFKTNILKRLQIDFRPRGKYKNIMIYKDTGYQLREKFFKNGYEGILLKCKSTYNYKSGPFHKIMCDEYYLEGFKEIFCCHFKKGSFLGKKSKHVFNWKKNEIFKKGWKIKIKKMRRKKFIKFFILKAKYNLFKPKAKKEKNKWIRMCRILVDNFNEI